MAKNPLYTKVASSDKKQFTVAHFYQLWKNDKLDMDTYQRIFNDRRAKWNTRLIESQVCGISLGEVMIQKINSEDGLDTMNFVVDGQHRLVTLMRYMDGQIKMSARWQEHTNKEHLGNKVWSELPSSFQQALSGSTLSVYEFEDDEDFDADQIFLKMNQGGNKLSKIDRFHAQHHKEPNYQSIYKYADAQWLSYNDMGAPKRHHVRALLQHLMDYTLYCRGEDYNKMNLEMDFYINDIATWSENKIRTELKKVDKFITLYNTLSAAGSAERITDKKSARQNIFVNIVLRSMLDKYSNSALIQDIQAVRSFWDTWMVDNQVKFMDDATDSRRSYVIPATFNVVIQEFLADLDQYLNLPAIKPGVSATQRKQIIDDAIGDDGKVEDAITGVRLEPSMVDVGHKVARADGGDTSPENLELQHKTINRSRRV
ncbi:MAG TPA: DUF262 domain-containing protein [Flavobacteriales bacterium]|nr:DUF262 domain-containing protein [Flavobacteriales bacterium]